MNEPLEEAIVQFWQWCNTEGQAHKMSEITSVILFANGMVMVFGRDGQQIAEYQGRYDEVKDKIRAVYQSFWAFGVWDTWLYGGLSFEAIELTVTQLKASWHDEQ